jgi:Pyruvate/2-oxoacid:ferredoxin oxidoreductase delta subunit
MNNEAISTPNDAAETAEAAAVEVDPIESMIDGLPLFPNRGKPERQKAPRSFAVIDQNGCTGCEVCIDFCPVDCIEIVPGPDYKGLFNVVEVDLDRCIGCTLCSKFCPWETIYMIKDTEAESEARETTVRSVMYPWGKEKYPGQSEYYEALETAGRPFRGGEPQAE